MLWVLAGGVILIVVLFVVLGSALRAPRADEESAHARALTRRQAAERAETDRRQERRYRIKGTQGTAAVLGRDESAACRIINVSRSGMRIALRKPLPPEAQVNVTWEDKFFVGSIRYSFVEGEEHILGLGLISSNSSPRGLLAGLLYQFKRLFAVRSGGGDSITHTDAHSCG
jgi:hypothetical protein